jgi:hypothetical protein
MEPAAASPVAEAADGWAEIPAGKLIHRDGVLSMFGNSEDAARLDRLSRSDGDDIAVFPTGNEHADLKERPIFWQPIAIAKGGVLRSVEVSPDGRFVVTVVGEQGVTVNGATNGIATTFRPHERTVGAALSPDGRQMATVGVNEPVKLWRSGAGMTQQGARLGE